MEVGRVLSVRRLLFFMTAKYETTEEEVGDPSSSFSISNCSNWLVAWACCWFGRA